MPDEFDSKPLTLDLTDPFHLPGGRTLGSRVELFLVDLLKERTQEELQILENGLSLEEKQRQRAQRGAWPTTRIRARAWARRILGYYLGVEPRKILFHQDPGGKPWVSHPGLHFNLSHSGRYLFFAISGRGPLGCDIEVVRPRNQLESLVKRVFAEEEQIRMQKSPCDLHSQFYRGWTIKEAYVKAIGKGIALGLERVVVREDHLAFNSVPEGRADDFRIWHQSLREMHLALVCPGPHLDLCLWDETR